MEEITSLRDRIIGRLRFKSDKGKNQRAGSEVKDDGLEKHRQNKSYLRLKRDLVDAGRDFSRDGLEDTDLSFGNLVDVCKTYCKLAESDGSHAKQTLRRIGELQFGKERIGSVNLLITQLFGEDNDEVESEMYDVGVSLEQVVDDGQGDLSHYPGGLLLKQKLPGSNGKYVFMLTNRQQSDEGKGYMKGLFEEVGIPIESNIRD